eukprot:CAMPEP_0113963404 /NCGR_PEP_ID=MMETSP0011_2-20120614/6491_1 /TAXON_ID=101924 /ORGANISM="Rhodosorus marinus" /LENGTH=54 /DNA_ID=CAMNT_0000975443 /DNA_START=625 /DNA_END=786 /DNA_ORIENTATION=+ /assembly_acc=CAM_ASM_000156
MKIRSKVRDLKDQSCENKPKKTKSSKNESETRDAQRANRNIVRAQYFSYLHTDK